MWLAESSSGGWGCGVGHRLNDVTWMISYHGIPVDIRQSIQTDRRRRSRLELASNCQLVGILGITDLDDAARDLDTPYRDRDRQHSSQQFMFRRRSIHSGSLAAHFLESSYSRSTVSSLWHIGMESGLLNSHRYLDDFGNRKASALRRMFPA